MTRRRFHPDLALKAMIYAWTAALAVLFIASAVGFTTEMNDPAAARASQLRIERAERELARAKAAATPKIAPE